MAKKTTESKTPTNIADLIPDNKNFNKGTQYGQRLMENSLEKFGFGRSILLDKNNRVIAGNKTLQTCADIGLENVRVVETTGNEIVAVKRTDIDLDTKKGREFALADNATGKANLAWDEEALLEASEELEISLDDWGVEIGDDISPDEFSEDFSLPDGDKSPFQQITFTLADEQAEAIKEALEEVKKTEEYKYVETFGNENSNGNAIYLIIKQWAEQRK